MGKAQFTKVIAAFEQAMIGSAQEKLQQRSDLEALVEQIEQETLEQKRASFGGVAHSCQRRERGASFLTALWMRLRVCFLTVWATQRAFFLTAP